MVELKLNKEKLKNLKFSDLKKKAHETSLVLSNIVPIHDHKIVIFPSNLKPSVERRFNLVSSEIRGNFIVKDIDELKAEYF
jgi:hypothetical protein